MNASILTTIAVTGFTIAFLHAAIPTHWLPFVLTGRVQKWSRAKTLLVTAVCGSGHVLFTAALGFLVAWLGIAISDRVGVWFPRIAGGTLLLFGLFYVYRQFTGHGHGHSHLFGGHGHDHGHEETDGHKHGPHGGPLVDTGHGRIELSVFETGVPPLFRLYFTDAAGREIPPPAPSGIALSTRRPDGTRQDFSFFTAANYLESLEEIPEPHEFTVLLELRHGGHVHTHEVAFIEGHDHGAHGHEPAAEPRPPAPASSDWAAMVTLFTLLTFSPCEGFIPVYVSGIRYGWGGFALLTLILSVATIAGMVTFTWLTLVGLEKLKLRWLERYESGVMGGLLCLLGLFVIVFEK
jgi:ABC-type nickel/cobalt efflux system permease component RcnA